MADAAEGRRPAREDWRAPPSVEAEIVDYLITDGISDGRTAQVVGWDVAAVRARRIEAARIARESRQALSDDKRRKRLMRNRAYIERLKAEKLAIKRRVAEGKKV